MRIAIEDGNYVAGYADYTGNGESHVIGIYVDNGRIKVGASMCLPVRGDRAKIVLECMSATFSKAEELARGE